MQPGVQVGAYRVVRQIGEGGMGTVWLAQHAMLGRRAAIKVLRAELSGRSEVVTRFFNEARAATAISDPGIVQIFDFGHHTDGTAYIVMEFLEGEGLQQRLERVGRLPVDDALRIIRQTAASLGAAHAVGIVHRDLKPENIFLVRDPEVVGGERAKLLDFGIAKLAGDIAGIKTQTSTVMGTPTYMSPEQCRGAGHVDQRSDVYSLGCVLFTLIAGGPPFISDGAGELIAMHLREPAPRLWSRAPWVPRAIDEVVACCLEKDPARRYPSGADLAYALAGLSAQHAGAGTTDPGPAWSALPTTMSGASAAISTPPRGNGRTFVGAGAAALVVGALVALAVLGTGADDAAEPRVAHVVAPGSPTAPPPPGDVTLPSGGVAPPGAVAPPPPEAATSTPAAPATDAASAPDTTERAKRHIAGVLAAFPAWAAEHATSPCPTAADLAGAMGDAHAVDDPWGHPLSLTCTDQPADHIIGAISAGPDGALQTDDDIASWTLERKLTRPVAGAHWRPRKRSAEPAAPAGKPATAPPSKGNYDDGIPRQR